MTTWSEHCEEFSGAAQCDRAARREAGADVPGGVKTDPRCENLDEKGVR